MRKNWEDRKQDPITYLVLLNFIVRLVDSCIVYIKVLSPGSWSQSPIVKIVFLTTLYGAVPSFRVKQEVRGNLGPTRF